MKLFEVAVIYHPSKSEEKNGMQDYVAVNPIPVLAKDEAAAKVKATFKIPENLRDKTDQLEVLVRPF